MRVVTETVGCTQLQAATNAIKMLLTVANACTSCVACMCCVLMRYWLDNIIVIMFS